MSEKVQCKEHVFSGKQWDFRGHQCTRSAWKDGFCKIHHPESVKVRQEISMKRWDEKFENSTEQKLLERVKELEKENEELKKVMEASK